MPKNDLIIAKAIGLLQVENHKFTRIEKKTIILDPIMLDV
jgi:hypothetical protein